MLWLYFFHRLGTCIFPANHCKMVCKKNQSLYFWNYRLKCLSVTNTQSILLLHVIKTELFLFFLSQYLFFSKYIKFKQSGEIMLICYKNIISWHTSYVFTIKFISKTKSAKMMIASLHIFMKSDVSFRNSCTFILNDFRMTMKNILP